MSVERTPMDVASDMLTMGVSWQTISKFAEPTPRDQVRTKPGKGGSGALSYVDARYVMKRLDEVCGPYWQRDHRMEGEKVACGIGILIDGTWIWRWDGAGETDIEGEKGSFSDAFKRAAVSWGIARDLYPEPNQGSQATPSPVQADAGRGAPPPRPAAAAPQSSDGEVPKCPLHGWPMKPSRNGQGFYCSTRAKPGEPQKNGYCIERAD